jgi:hypothetical protein
MLSFMSAEDKYGESKPRHSYKAYNCRRRALLEELKVT